jgi:hypothetical protein
MSEDIKLKEAIIRRRRQDGYPSAESRNRLD